jgi:hypothetical protein
MKATAVATVELPTSAAQHASLQRPRFCDHRHAGTCGSETSASCEELCRNLFEGRQLGECLRVSAFQLAHFHAGDVERRRSH